jgi:tRNA (guanine-N7-)-methyltransferase
MSQPSSENQPPLDYHATSFSQGRMDFAWEELSDAERDQAYADWDAGKGLIGGDPRLRPGSEMLPAWGLDRSFFRCLALDDTRGDNGERWRSVLSSALPIEVEIGFGRGDFLLDQAARFPERILVGYETKNKATRLMLDRVDRSELGNVWLSDDDCRFNIPLLLPDGRISAFHILFPDPWWKPQHKVKRLFSPPFVELLANKLCSGGLLFFKSDVYEYGELVRYLIEQHGEFLPHDENLASRIGPYAPTHREHWCERHNRPVYAYYFERR